MGRMERGLLPLPLPLRFGPTGPARRTAHGRTGWSPRRPLAASTGGLRLLLLLGCCRRQQALAVWTGLNLLEEGPTLWRGGLPLLLVLSGRTAANESERGAPQGAWVEGSESSQGGLQGTRAPRVERQ